MFVNFFGYIHQSRDKENISVESLRARAGISRSTADKVRNSLVEKKLIGKNNKFFGKHSCYIGIAVYSKYIDISACGLDGKTISLEERFSSNVRLKLEDYSIDGFVKVTEVIRNIITTIKIFLNFGLLSPPRRVITKKCILILVLGNSND